MRRPSPSGLWRNPAFVRVWTAATISIFGSLITRMALPLVAILVLGSGALEVALLRGLELGAALLFGLVAGAWVDRLRRRPVLIWADLGRAVLLGSVPVAFVVGGLSYGQLLLGSIRQREAAPPPPETRDPVLREIRAGIDLVWRDPILRAFAGAQMCLAALWGVFGATWFLFVLDDLGLGPAVMGLVAGVGGASSFIGAIAAGRATRRWGVGRVAIGAMILAAVGNAFVPLAPAGLPLLAIVCLVLQQLVADSAVTVYDITEVSVRQSFVHDRALGRVASTFKVAAMLAQLLATLGAGVIAEAVGVRATAWIAPLGGLVAAAVLWASPVRRLVDLPAAAALGRPPAPDPLAIAVAIEMEQPPGA